MKKIVLIICLASTLFSYAQSDELKAWNDSLELIWKDLPNIPEFDAVSPQQLADSDAASIFFGGYVIVKTP